MANTLNREEFKWYVILLSYYISHSFTFTLMTIFKKSFILHVTGYKEGPPKHFQDILFIKTHETSNTFSYMSVIYYIISSKKQRQFLTEFVPIYPWNFKISHIIFPIYSEPQNRKILAHILLLSFSTEVSKFCGPTCLYKTLKFIAYKYSNIEKKTKNKNRKQANTRSIFLIVYVLFALQVTWQGVTWSCHGRVMVVSVFPLFLWQLIHPWNYYFNKYQWKKREIDNHGKTGVSETDP